MTEYKSELSNGLGYLIYADYSELPLSRTEVEYILKAQEKLIEYQTKKFKEVTTFLEDSYAVLYTLSEEGLISIIEKIMLILFDKKSMRGLE